MLLIKTILKILISSATACSSNIIDIEMDPLASLSVPATPSSPISGYRLIDMSILADVFMLLSCRGVIVFIALNFVTLIEKIMFGKTFITQLPFVYIAIKIDLESRLIYRRKTKEDKNFMM